MSISEILLFRLCFSRTFLSKDIQNALTRKPSRRSHHITPFQFWPQPIWVIRKGMANKLSFIFILTPSATTINHLERAQISLGLFLPLANYSIVNSAIKYNLYVIAVKEISLVVILFILSFSWNLLVTPISISATLFLVALNFQQQS